MRYLVLPMLFFMAIPLEIYLVTGNNFFDMVSYH